MNTQTSIIADNAAEAGPVRLSLESVSEPDTSG